MGRRKRYDRLAEILRPVFAVPENICYGIPSTNNFIPPGWTIRAGRFDVCFESEASDVDRERDNHGPDAGQDGGDAAGGFDRLLEFVNRLRGRSSASTHDPADEANEAPAEDV